MFGVNFGQVGVVPAGEEQGVFDQLGPSRAHEGINAEFALTNTGVRQDRKRPGMEPSVSNNDLQAPRSGLFANHTSASLER